MSCSAPICMRLRRQSIRCNLSLPAGACPHHAAAGDLHAGDSSALVLPKCSNTLSAGLWYNVIVHITCNHPICMENNPVPFGMQRVQRRMQTKTRHSFWMNKMNYSIWPFPWKWCCFASAMNINGGWSSYWSEQRWAWALNRSEGNFFEWGDWVEYHWSLCFAFADHWQQRSKHLVPLPRFIGILAISFMFTMLAMGCLQKAYCG